MKYIPRRLSVRNDFGEEVEYLDTEFFSIDAPLVVLGEPGAGKTTLIEMAENKLDAKRYNASTIESLTIADLQPPATIIVDGVDEITAYNTETPINKILSKLPKSVNFILTCRAADWQDYINSSIIRGKWGKPPVIGRILPLNEQEIIDFVNAYDDEQNGDEFIKEARHRDILDLLKNPMTLSLLLDAVKSDGWPDTRLKLYENACKSLIQEDNRNHNSINRTRPTAEKLTDAAGFIFAQLLLSGKTAVLIDGDNNVQLPKVADLHGGNIKLEDIKSALSTKVFRTAEGNTLESCHRTVAEFLAAKWLANALRDKLSIKRLEGLLYGNGYIVPTALRGLHAWIATLSPAFADTFIARDPYGFFRYGDPASLNIQQSKNLLQCLKKTAEFDPYFRSEDWHATFGKGLAKSELREDIVQLIRDPKTPYQLSHLIIESIQGDGFADSISSDLLAIALNISATQLERNAAVDALSECKTQPDWLETVDKLCDGGSLESLRIAFDIVCNNIESFSGTVIANILLEMAEAKAEENSNLIGLGWNIHKKMSTDQLEESLQILSENTSEKTRRGHGEADEWLYRFVQERFERSSLPPASTVWSWLKNSKRSSYHRSDWDKYSQEYFSQQSEYRQEVQAEAISAANNAQDLWMALWHIGDASRGLWLREEDVICHIDALLANRKKYADWPERWRNFVQWGKINRDFSGEVLERANRQAEQYAELKIQLDDLNKPPERDYEAEEKEREQKYTKEEQQKRRARHQSYDAIQNDLRAGKYLGVLGDIAKAYLGRFYELKEQSTPIDRVEELVGSKMHSIAFEGLAAVMQRDEIPTAKQLIELRTKENKESFFEPILLAHCAMHIQKGEDLSNIPMNITNSALASCHWGLSFNDDFTANLEKELEKLVFQNKESKELFIRDTMEPYLEVCANHISGMYRLVRNEEFSDVAGILAMEWLGKYPSLSDNSLRELIIAAVNYAPKNEVVSMIRTRVNDESWDNEEQRGIWFGAAFLLDYEHHKDLFSSYIGEGKERLWPLRAMSFPEREKLEYWPKLNASQNYFLIKGFANLWPPSNGWSGDSNPWDASNFIQGRIGDLAAYISDEAESFLRSLIDDADAKEYQNQIKHVYAQQIRRRAEENKYTPDLTAVRNILLKGEPANIDDLQNLMMDELEALQNRIKGGQTNDILTFWIRDKDKKTQDIPSDENDCRDRITAFLAPYLERYDVRPHAEGTMPNNTRCDLLNTHGSMDLPIEIKGQWHPDIWTAATDQLQNYTNSYRAEGRGIYLVLWFGDLGANNSKNTRGWQGQARPKTYDEMKNLLFQKYKDISEKTTIFVLNVSKAD